MQLAKTGKISLTQKDIAKKIGELFIQRNNVNLTSDLLDTPAFFWDSDTHEVRACTGHGRRVRCA